MNKELADALKYNKKGKLINPLNTRFLSNLLGAGILSANAVVLYFNSETKSSTAIWILFAAFWFLIVARSAHQANRFDKLIEAEGIPTFKDPKAVTAKEESTTEKTVVDSKTLAEVEKDKQKLDSKK